MSNCYNYGSAAFALWAINPTALLHRLQGQSGRIRVAYSGGVDSTVLLNLLVRAQPQLNISAEQLQAVHINHQLHPQADSWEQHCSEYCKSLGVEFYSVKVDVKAPQGEGEARSARYAVLQQLQQTGDWLLMAHHADDQAESLLLNLLRGQGFPGLGGMPEHRALAEGELWRPLLGLHRVEIIEYARKHGIAPIEDPANEDQRFARGYLRTQLAPVLESRWPNWKETLARTAVYLRNQAARSQRDNLKKLAVISRTPDVLRIDALKQQPEEDWEELLRLALRLENLPQPSLGQMQQLIHGICNYSEGAVVGWQKTVRCRFWQGHLWLTRYQAPPASRIWSLVKESEFALGSVCMRRNRGVGHLKLPNSVRVQFRQGGEVLHNSHRGGSRKLKRLLQESPTAPWERYRLPLLYDGEVLAAFWDGRDWIANQNYWSEGAEGDCIEITTTPKLSYALDLKPSAGIK